MQKFFFSIKFFQLFLILLKKVDVKQFLIYNRLPLKFLTSLTLRKFIYIYYFKILDNKFKLFFFNAFYWDFKNLKNIFFIFLNNVINIKDYSILYILEYFLRSSKIYNIKANYFVINKKPSKFVLHRYFQVRMPWYCYLFSGSYIEHFKNFKYLEHLKFSHLGPEIKWTLSRHESRYIPLWRQFSINLLQDKFIFYNNKAVQIPVLVKPILYKHSFLLIKKTFIILWQYFFCNLYLYSNNIYFFWKYFFRISFAIFCYKFLWIFIRNLTDFIKFHKGTLMDFLEMFCRIRYKYTKYIIMYNARSIIKKFSLFYPLSLFPINLTTGNYLWLTKNLDLSWFQVCHRVHFYRILRQYEKDRDYNLNKLFLLLWEVFIEFYYFDFAFIHHYFSTYDECIYWSLFLQYNWENLLCKIYYNSHYSFKIKFYFKRINTSLLQYNTILNSILTTIYIKYFFNINPIKKSKQVFFF